MQQKYYQIDIEINNGTNLNENYKKNCFLQYRKKNNKSIS